MSKGRFRVKKDTRRGKETTVTFDPRLSMDRKTLVIRQETSVGMFYEDHLKFVVAWCHEELAEMARKEGDSLN